MGEIISRCHLHDCLHDLHDLHDFPLQELGPRCFQRHTSQLAVTDLLPHHKKCCQICPKAILENDLHAFGKYVQSICDKPKHENNAENVWVCIFTVRLYRKGEKERLLQITSSIQLWRDDSKKRSQTDLASLPFPKDLCLRTALPQGLFPQKILVQIPLHILHKC